MSANSGTFTNIPVIAPVIAIDGPSASGKGTVAQLVAEQLGFHYLDSGALYRIVALAAKRMDIGWQASDDLGKLAKTLQIGFKNADIYLNGEIITTDVRAEDISRGASEVAIHKPVRQALFDLQKSFRKLPGLVADGRDMGSVVFTDAALKIFLTATVDIRAKRRYKQANTSNTPSNISTNPSVNSATDITDDYAQILHDLHARDLRDSQRSAAPLIQTPDAVLLDTSYRSIQDAVEFVINEYTKVNTQKKVQI